jgi:hypothetical protein
VRVLFLTIVTAAVTAAVTAPFAAAQSHPSWWTYASPDATALVGIQWENLRKSPLADTVGAELSSRGSLGFPDLDCLKQARQILLSAPALLVIESGVFPAAGLREQAAGAGLRSIRYRGVQLWIPSKADILGVAQMSDQLVLVGARKTLEAAIDNSLAETGRRYSPLLARAGRFSQTADLWVVSTQLPDPLASLFVPFEAEAQGFEGALRVRDGLDAQAWIDTGSERGAIETAERIRQGAPGVQITSGAARVAVTLQLTLEELKTALHPLPHDPPAVEITSGAPAPPPTPPVQAKPAVVASVPSPEPAPSPAPAPPPPPAPVRQVIRIIGMDGGPIEIPFPNPPKN